MTSMIRGYVIAAAAAGLALGTMVPAAPARADAAVKVGVLTCHVASGWGFVFGSSRSLRCVYTGGGHSERYVGEISKFGVDIGFTQSGVIVWGVFAPTTDFGVGALSGKYAGATGGVAVGVGADANVLIGGSTKSISLQPLSIGGETGLNLAAGIAAVTLKHQR
jgi:hypothetical protein